MLPGDTAAVRIQGLGPGHRYGLAVSGLLRDGRSLPIKEEQLLMDPAPLDFAAADAVSAQLANITLRAFKADRALQDKFSVKYVQVDPLKRFPTLEVQDLPEQRFVELYLGNLSPGRDYDVTVTSVRGPLSSTPWKRLISTRESRAL